MNRFIVLFALILSTFAVVLAVLTVREMPRQFSAGENKLRMSVLGTGSPAVIFDAFGPANLEIWNRVQPEVARFARTVTYDHGGYWGSEPGRKPRDARQIALELHTALRAANVPPPYILVGYSCGGPYARVFAGMYPNEVSGLLLIDPTQEEFMDMFTVKYSRFYVVSEKHRVAQNEWGCQSDSLAQAKESRLPNLPITVITGMAKQDMLKNKLLPQWLESHQKWISQFPQGKHLVTTNSGHNVVLKEPELVIEAVRQMVEKILPEVPPDHIQ
jgi:pimeloyl-ACP methyl ester carboxylesterase